LRREFRGVLLMVLVCVSLVIIGGQFVFIRPVHANPGPVVLYNSYDSYANNHATDFTVTNIGNDLRKNAYDKEINTFMYFVYSTTSGKALEVYNFSIPEVPPTIDVVGFNLTCRVTNNTAGSPNDEYRIVYYVSPSATAQVLLDWTYERLGTYDEHGIFIGPKAYMWANQSEPNDGNWSWADVNNIRFAVETDKQGPSDPGCEFFVYEAWVTVFDTTGAQYRSYANNDVTDFTETIIGDALREEAHDKDYLSHAYFVYSTTSGKALEVYNFTIPGLFDLVRPTIAQVNFKMRYNVTENVAVTPNDEYRIVYYVSPNTTAQVLVDWTDAAVPLGIYTWANQSEPNDGTWNWTDVNNIQFAVETSVTDTSDPGCEFFEYEAWVTVLVPPTALRVDPSMTRGISGGGSFSIDIRADNVIDLYSYEFILLYNTSVLTATSASTYSPFTIPTIGSGIFINDPAGYVFMCFHMMFGTIHGVSSNSTKLATINFDVTVSGESGLDLSGTLLGSAAHTGGISITHIPYNGYFNTLYKLHDVAVTGVSAPTKVPVGGIAYINVTVKNEGNYTETFNVTAYSDTDPIDTQTGITLSAGSNITLEFIWDLTGIAPGVYTISAEATVVPLEVWPNLDDNTYIDGEVYVKIPGDVDGDRDVDASDLSDLRNAYGFEPGDSNWDEDCDFNGDNKVDASDLFDLGKNYGKSI